MWANIQSEDGFEAQLSESLAAELEDRGLLSEMALDRSRKIAKDAAFTRSGSGEAEFRIYFSETDIVLFEHPRGDDPGNPGEMITDELAGASGVALDRLNLNKEASDQFRSPATLGEVLVPRYIVELKLEGTITHDYLTYSQKASQFKQMFHGVEFAMVIRSWIALQTNS